MVLVACMVRRGSSYTIKSLLTVICDETTVPSGTEIFQKLLALCKLAFQEPKRYANNTYQWTEIVKGGMRKTIKPVHAA